MIKTAFEFIVLAILVVVELFGMASDGNDRSSKAYVERTRYLIQNQAELDNIKDAAYDLPYGGGFQTVQVKKIAPEDFKVIEHVVRQDRIKLHNNDDMTKDYLQMDLYGRVDGFSDTSYMYFYDDPATSIDKLTFGNARYNSNRQCYEIYNAANYREISRVSGNWYISVTAYNRDSEFKTDPERYKNT